MIKKTKSKLSLGDTKLGQRPEGHRPEPLDWRSAQDEQASPTSAEAPIPAHPKTPSRRKTDPVNIPKLIRFAQRDIDRLEHLVTQLKDRSPALAPSEAALIRVLIYLATKLPAEDLLDAAVPGWRQANER